MGGKVATVFWVLNACPHSTSIQICIQVPAKTKGATQLDVTALKSLRWSFLEQLLYFVQFFLLFSFFLMCIYFLIAPCNHTQMIYLQDNFITPKRLSLFYLQASICFLVTFVQQVPWLCSLQEQNKQISLTFHMYMDLSLTGRNSLR